MVHQSGEFVRILHGCVWCAFEVFGFGNPPQTFLGRVGNQSADFGLWLHHPLFPAPWFREKVKTQTCAQPPFVCARPVRAPWPCGRAVTATSPVPRRVDQEESPPPIAAWKAASGWAFSASARSVGDTIVAPTVSWCSTLWAVIVRGSTISVGKSVSSRSTVIAFWVSVSYRRCRWGLGRRHLRRHLRHCSIHCRCPRVHCFPNHCLLATRLRFPKGARFQKDCLPPGRCRSDFVGKVRASGQSGWRCGLS